MKFVPPVRQTSLVWLLAVIGCPMTAPDLPDGGDHPDAGLDVDISSLCGDQASVVDLGDGPLITGNCIIRLRNQVPLLNDSGFTVIGGTLTMQPGPGELGRVQFDNIVSINVLQIGPSADLLGLRFPELRDVERFTVTGNAEFDNVEAPQLRTVSETLFATDNPLLPTCVVEDLLAQLDTAPPEVLVEGNCDECCP